MISYRFVVSGDYSVLLSTLFCFLMQWGKAMWVCMSRRSLVDVYWRRTIDAPLFVRLPVSFAQVASSMPRDSRGGVLLGRVVMVVGVWLLFLLVDANGS